MGKRGVITKAGKAILNPTDAYRKEIRKRELKKNAKERKRNREIVVLKNDPEKLREEIKRLKALGPKAKEGLKLKRKQLEDLEQKIARQRRMEEERLKQAEFVPAPPIGQPPPLPPFADGTGFGMAVPPPPQPGPAGMAADDDENDEDSDEEDEDDLDEQVVPPPPGAPPGFLAGLGPPGPPQGLPPAPS
eukprot:EG_transcript_31461